jgi:c-di-GMP-related signal transduction protein
MKYLARQPILNRSRELFAYELLFRSSLQNSCDVLNLEVASTSAWILPS